MKQHSRQMGTEHQKRKELKHNRGKLHIYLAACCCQFAHRYSKSATGEAHPMVQSFQVVAPLSRLVFRRNGLHRGAEKQGIAHMRETLLLGGAHAGYQSTDTHTHAICWKTTFPNTKIPQVELGGVGKGGRRNRVLGCGFYEFLGWE